MPTNLKIDYLELPARNLDAMQTFYQQIFGWTFTDYGPEYRAFNDGRLDGGFYASDKASSTENGAALIVFFAEDLEGVKTAVLSNGGKLIKDIFPFPGGRRFHFGDPSGNELAVWSDK